MKNGELLSKEWCEIVFEGRKRDYGAYMLRREAGRRYRRALWGLVCLVVCLMVLPLWLKEFVVFHRYADRQPLSELSVLQLRQLPFKEGYEDWRPIAKAEEALSGGRVVNSVPKIVDVVKPPQPVGLIPDVTATGEMLAQFQEELLASGAASLAPSAESDDEQMIEPTMLTADEMPEFPGGMVALMRWIDRHLKYPSHLARRTAEGELEVSFFVDKDGWVKDAFISKSLHPRLDTLALRVVGKMPKWHPPRRPSKLEIIQVSIPIRFDY